MGQYIICVMVKRNRTVHIMLKHPVEHTSAHSSIFILVYNVICILDFR
jgi:hypothetical protein